MISVTVGFSPLELYPDENIEITRQQRNLRDLNKLYSDYSKSFQIPASDHNNELLKHWYDLAIVNSINAAQAIYGTWQLPNSQNDTLCIIELLGVSLKNGQPDSYSIVVYGATRRISDEFGERLLNTLNLNAYQHGLDYATLRDSWQGNLFDGAILYPMFDYSRGWIYESSGTYAPDQDIATPTGQILLQELRPAMLLRTLFIECFKAIGITLTGDFLTSPLADQLYLLPMEKSGIYKESFSSGVFDVENTAPLSLFDLNLGRQKVIPFDQVYDAGGNVDVNAQEYTAPYNGSYTFQFAGVTSIVYQDGADLDMILVVNGVDTLTVTKPISQDQSVTAVFTLNLIAGDVVWLYFEGSNQQRYLTLEPYSIFQCSNAPASGTSIPINMSEVMPSIKITDFIKSCIDAFNLVFVPLPKSTLLVQTLDNWYRDGKTLDITELADTREYQFERPEMPTTLTFAHDQKEDIANTAYANANGREFASTEYVSPSSFTSGSLDINTIFQAPVPDLIARYNPSGQQIGSSELETVKAYDADLKAVQIPMLLFFYAGEQSVSDSYYVQVDLVNPNTPPVLLNTWPFCRCYSERPAQQSSYSVAFSVEPVLDEQTEDAPFNTLIQTYWQNYLRNTFDQQNRLLTLDVIYTDGAPSELPLNTRILYNNQTYIILELSYSTASNVYTFLLERFLLNSPQTTSLIASSGNQIFTEGLQTNESPELLGFGSYVSGSVRNLLPVRGSSFTVAPERSVFIGLNSTPSAKAVTALQIVSNWVSSAINLNDIASLVLGNARISKNGIYRIYASFGIDFTSAGKTARFQISVNGILVGPATVLGGATNPQQLILEHWMPLFVGDVIAVTAIKVSGGGNVTFNLSTQQLILQRI